MTERLVAACRLDGALTNRMVPVPGLASSVRARIEAPGLMLYLQVYVEGKLPFYMHAR